MPGQMIHHLRQLRETARDATASAIRAGHDLRPGDLRRALECRERRAATNPEWKALVRGYRDGRQAVGLDRIPPAGM